MLIDEVNTMIKTAQNKEKVIVVGAGKKFFNLLALLRNNGINVEEVFDNNPELIGKTMDGAIVSRPYKAIEDTLYIIDVKSEIMKKQLKDMLMDLGISASDIIFQPMAVVDDLVNLEDKENAKRIIDDLYCERFGRYINWDNPLTYNEIINSEKIYDRDIRKTKLADKYLVRDYVRERIGEEYLINLIGCWKRPEDIDFDMLPEQFVLKTNNGSSRNIIVTDKKCIDRESIREQLKQWLNSDYWKGLLEYQYKDIPPVILCEEYIPNMDTCVKEYKLYCFHGKVHYIGQERNSHRPGWSSEVFDCEWRNQGFSYATPLGEFNAEKPRKLDEMIHIGEVLSEGFKHVRVDLYEKENGDLLFGEMTFSSWGGMKHFVPETWDIKFGQLINSEINEV